MTFDETFEVLARPPTSFAIIAFIRMSLRDRLTVVTVAATGDKDTLYSDLLRNSITHYARIADAPRYVVHALDNRTFSLCAAAASSAVTCVRAPCCTRDPFHSSRLRLSALKKARTPRAELPNLQWKEEVLNYKLRAMQIELRAAKGAVLVLDLDALITHAACFEEISEYAEPIVMQGGGYPGCPTSTYSTLGINPNTGVMMMRQAALPFLDALLLTRANRFVYHHTCFEQELFASGVLAAEPRWHDFPNVLAITASGGEALQIRFLNYSRFPAHLNGKALQLIVDNRLDKAAPTRRTVSFPLLRNASKRCVYHDLGNSKTNRTWIERGVWFVG